MPVARTLARTVGLTLRGVGLTVRSGARTSRWLGRQIGHLRDRGAAGEIGMIRLLDLHAASCAGDTLVTLGLAGTIFFAVPTEEARGRVGLYLLATMAPFALLAPVIGPLLDHFRHGRRWALAATMLGRAFLAWLISDYINGIGLYPAAFGVLVLSRAYGVARSAAVPRLLPPGLGLSEAGARASVYGTIAGALVAPVGAAAFWFGPQWPLRVATVIFTMGMVIALRLPPRADASPPEAVPHPWQMLRRRKGVKVLSGQLVIATLVGSSLLRALFGFLTLFLAFAVRSGGITSRVAGVPVNQAAALALVAGSLGVGAFLATAIGTRTRIHRPTVLQAVALAVVVVFAVVATLNPSVVFVTLLALVTAVAAGLAKLALDATIQERIPEPVRASAFAHSETLLMLAWVAGGAIGLIPVGVRTGLAAAAAFAFVALLRSVYAASTLRRVHLRGEVNHDSLWHLEDEPPVRHRRPHRERPGGPGRPATGTRPRPDAGAGAPAPDRPRAATMVERDDQPQPPPADEPPAYHLYRPTSSRPATEDGKTP
jgi:MFS family permease